MLAFATTVNLEYTVQALRALSLSPPPLSLSKNKRLKLFSPASKTPTLPDAWTLAVCGRTAWHTALWYPTVPTTSRSTLWAHANLAVFVGSEEILGPGPTCAITTKAGWAVPQLKKMLKDAELSPELRNIFDRLPWKGQSCLMWRASIHRNTGCLGSSTRRESKWNIVKLWNHPVTFCNPGCQPCNISLETPGTLGTCSPPNPGLPHEGARGIS